MARGGQGDSGSGERAAGKEAHLDFAVSSGPASNAGLAGTSPGVAVAAVGPGGSQATGPPLPSGTSEKNE